MGLTPLRPEAAAFATTFRPGAIAQLDCGAVSCRLIPRALAEVA